MNKKEEQKLSVTPIIVTNQPEPKKSKFKLKPSLLKFKKKKPKKVKKKEKVLRHTPEILPFLRIENDCIVMKNGVMDILQITTRDLYSTSEQELQIALFSQAKFMRSYYEAYKIVALNFPSNTAKQRNYWLKKQEQTEDLLRLKFIDRKLFELEFLEKERTNREFFLFLYANDKEQLYERKNYVSRHFQQMFPLRELTIEKKQDVLFKLNNQNSKL